MTNMTAEASTVLLPALEQSTMAVVLIDENDRVLFFNPAAEKLWGYASDEVLGHNVKLLVPHEVRGMHDSYTRRNREGGAPRVVGKNREVLMERKDGRRLWAMLSLSRVDLDGCIHYMAFVRDISHEVARREENRLLLLAVEHTDQPIFVLDRERRIVQVNRAFTEMFGYAAREAIGKLPGDLLACPSTDPETLSRLRDKARLGARFSEEVLARSRNGREFWIKSSVNPIFDETSQAPVNHIVVLSDITEERLLRALERDVLEALTSSLSFEELGDYICRRIESIMPDVLVSICGIAERRMRPWAAPSFPPAYGEFFVDMEIGEGVASCGTAAHRGEPVMVYDIETDPLWTPYKHVMLPHGFRACWTYPVKRRDGSVAATFAFYFHESHLASLYLEHIADASVHLCTLAIEREENRQQLMRLVQFDALTGLPNRNHLHRHIDELLIADPGRKIVVFKLGLDRFKEINDPLGHAAGDRVLVEMANRLEGALSEGQFLARTEGDTFVLVVSGCGEDRTVQMMENIQKIINAPIELSGMSLALSVSIGVSHYPEDGRDRDELLQNAKNAMEQAKASGGGTYLSFNPEMNRLAHDRLMMGVALRQAVANGDLRLEYQPQVCLESGELYGVEALARWRSPDFGEVPPGRFIGLAEEIGEIEAIGRWALREACRQMAQWREAGIVVPVMSVNLSPLSFRNRDLSDFVAELLREYSLPGECLTLEITESAAMALTEEMHAILRRIRELGVGLSVDDFGTGFSSLSNLANLPVTEVKIDRSFIDKCLEEKRLQSLVTAVIGIGHSLELTVVAEGVETEAQRELLLEQACPVVQGYLLSRPLSAHDVPVWVGQKPDPEARMSG